MPNRHHRTALANPHEKGSDFSRGAMLSEFTGNLDPVFPHFTPLPLRVAYSVEGECKLVCLLACMMAQPFPNCLGYDVLLRPGFAPLDLSFHRRTRQIFN